MAEIYLSDECSQDVFSLWADSWSVGDPVLPRTFDEELYRPLDDLPLASPELSEEIFDLVALPAESDSPDGELAVGASDPEWFSEIFDQVCSGKASVVEQGECVEIQRDEEPMTLEIPDVVVDAKEILSPADSGRYSADLLPYPANEETVDEDNSCDPEFSTVDGENRVPSHQQSVPDISEHSYGSSLKLPSYYSERRIVRLPGGKTRLEASRSLLNPSRNIDHNIPSSTNMEMSKTCQLPKRVAARRAEIALTVDVSSEDEGNENDDISGISPRSRYSDEVSSSSRGQRRRSPSISEVNKNALNARINREKKKAYIASLEAQRARLTEENRRLKSSLSGVVGERDDLVEEVNYLKAVLANESMLARLIEGINGPTARLSSSVGTSGRKRKGSEGGNEPASKAFRAVAGNGGVCLHVRQDQLSVEFCHRCSRLSRNTRDNIDD